MLCCLVLLMLFGLIRRADGIGPFPPPARRTASGTPLPSPGISPSPAASALGTARAAIVRWSAIGALSYVAGVAVLRATGPADGLADPAISWFARDLLFVACAVSGLWLGGRGAGGRLPAARSRALALVGAGSAWLVLGLVDMHVFGLFEIAHGQVLWDAVFHGAGSWTIVAGLVLLQRSDPAVVATPFRVHQQGATA